MNIVVSYEKMDFLFVVFSLLFFILLPLLYTINLQHV